METMHDGELTSMIRLLWFTIQIINNYKMFANHNPSLNIYPKWEVGWKALTA